MFPVLSELELLGRTIPVMTYGVATFVAMLVGLAITRRHAVRLGIDPDHLLLGFVVLLPPILVGAKLLPLLLRGELGDAINGISAAVASSSTPAASVTAWVVFFLMPGGSSLGAALAGGLGLFAYSRWFRLPLGDMLDALAPALALGLPLMRLGCLAAGCCFGSSTGVPWAVVYTDPRAELAGGVALGVPLHPTPIYEAVAALALGILLLWKLGRRGFAGEVFLWFVIGYGAIRLLLTPLRGDAPVFPGAFAWLAAIAGGAAVLLWLRDRGRAPRPKPY
jgi:phosphatidylglycerol:prolipoprotein diacylglycerol transferase